MKLRHLFVWTYHSKNLFKVSSLYANIQQKGLYAIALIAAWRLRQRVYVHDHLQTIIMQGQCNCALVLGYIYT